MIIFTNLNSKNATLAADHLITSEGGGLALMSELFIFSASQNQINFCARSFYLFSHFANLSNMGQIVNKLICFTSHQRHLFYSLKIKIILFFSLTIFFIFFP